MTQLCCLPFFVQMRKFIYCGIDINILFVHLPAVFLNFVKNY